MFNTVFIIEWNTKEKLPHSNPKCYIFVLHQEFNKLAKAWKTRKSPGSLGLKKFGPGKLWVEKVWAQNIFIDFLAELDSFKKITRPISGNPMYPDPKLKNTWGPLSSTFHVGNQRCWQNGNPKVWWTYRWTVRHLTWVLPRVGARDACLSKKKYW